MKKAHTKESTLLIGDYIMGLTKKFSKNNQHNPNPHVRALGEVTPETAHAQTQHRWFERDT